MVIKFLHFKDLHLICIGLVKKVTDSVTNEKKP